MSSAIPLRNSAAATSPAHQKSSSIEIEWRNGHILGIEVPVCDLERATTFYERVFHWTFFRNGGSDVVHFRSGTTSGIVLQVEEYNHYTLRHHHSRGAMISNTGRSRAARAVAFTLFVDDMDETLHLVKNSGGRVWIDQEEFRDDLPGRNGYSAYILDTEENVVGLRSFDELEDDPS